MADYFRTTRSAKPKRGEWAEKLWEVQQSGAITRTVETGNRGLSLAASLQILARKSPAFAVYARAAENPCLLQNQYSSAADWQAAMKTQGLHAQPTTQANFERRFMTSNPDL